MKNHSLTHLADHVLLKALGELAARDRASTVEMLVHIAEVERRRLFLPLAYPSMYMYCVKELHMSEDLALRRIRVARAARRFPRILDAIADGRLNVSIVMRLAPSLTTTNADELLAAAEYKTRDEVLALLAARFPQPDVPTRIAPLVAAVPSAAAAAPEQPSDEASQAEFRQLAPAPVAPSITPELAQSPVPLPSHPKVAPLSPGRFSLQLTMDEATRERLRYAQELLGHAIPAGDVAQVIDRALQLLIEHLERTKFAETTRPGRRTSRADGRYIPADVRRKVWKRDGRQCTFVSANGNRCEARRDLEFDHVQAVARGGRSTIENLRLRCAAHNQYEADRAFGAGFMERKRVASGGVQPEAAPSQSRRAQAHPGHAALADGA